MKQNRIVSSLLFVFMVLALVAAGFARDELVKSQWIATPPSIDGMNTEWSDVSLNSYKKAKIDYAFMADQGAEADIFGKLIYQSDLHQDNHR